MMRRARCSECGEKFYPADTKTTKCQNCGGGKRRDTAQDEKFADNVRRKAGTAGGKPQSVDPRTGLPPEPPKPPKADKASEAAK